MSKEITVRFKEKYMKHPVERTCVNMTLEEVFEVYGLNAPDIEYWEVVEENEK